VLFQSVVLPCQYTSVSTRPAVVKWVYKSYCRDRTRDSFNFPDTLGGGLGGASYLDCSDNHRTVRTVASLDGSSVTLSEYYKNRDISIINKADLRMGEVQWGDSGVYICEVVIPDDLEGQNEASVELLVLGKTYVFIMQDFVLCVLAEWVFVLAVALGSILFLLLVGVCWCQCCPHSCCCYVSCWCCPDTCCCPRHLYEAGKGIKTTPQTPPYPPYFVSGVPTMVPITPPSLVDKISSVAPSDGTCALSELSSLHEGETGFRQTYRNVQKKALPAIPDHNTQPEPQRYRENRSPEPGRNRRQQDHSEEETHNRCRWNPRSEHLHRKTYRTAGRTGSLDELEEIAASYKLREGRGAERRDEEQREYEMERLEYSRYPSHREGPAQHYHSHENEVVDNSDRGPPSTSSQEKDYDATFLNSLLERKSKLRGVGQGKSGARGDEDSDTPSKSSLKKSSGESSRHCSRSPSNRPEADLLPPHMETERVRTDRPSPGNTHSPQPPIHSLASRREDPRNKSRKVSTLLSRDSLIV
uniref:Ig-like domain-containing protein n=1 Tax=Amphilophus citrinellus TaxID=61819 RepID=A0A3Q0R092_AMPCI